VIGDLSGGNHSHMAAADVPALRMPWEGMWQRSGHGAVPTSLLAELQ
jgi:hypothetical protein